MSGQQHFLKPTGDSIEKAFLEAKENKLSHRLWLGLDASRALFDRAARGNLALDTAIEQILQNAEKTPYLFAEETDGDPYHWLKQVGCYSPIVHLQQNDGKSSPHWPFDEQHNRQGIIRGKEVLMGLYESFCQPEDATLPPKCNKVVLIGETVPVVWIFGWIDDSPVTVEMDTGKGTEKFTLKQTS